MTSYPYSAGEHYPRTKAHREYLERYNTRIVSRPFPLLVGPRATRRKRRLTGFRVQAEVGRRASFCLKADSHERRHT